MLKIGLTGGIASGKSAVAEILGELGAGIIDTDVISREVVAPDTAGLAAVAEAFGTDILAPGGELDRAALRSVVFADAAKRSELEAILHPLIRTATLAAAETTAGDYLVFVVPLLIETNFSELVDRVLVVNCDPSLQIQRVIDRDQCSADDALRIVRSQIDPASRLAAADDVIHNNGTLAELRTATEAVHAQYLQLARN